MASNRLGWVLAALVVAGACTRGPSQAEQDSIANAELQAKRDSVNKAKAHRDSLEVAKYTACADSVRKALVKTAAGRRKLAVHVPEGQPRPENTAACGPMPTPLQHPGAVATTGGTPSAPAARAGATPATPPAAGQRPGGAPATPQAGAAGTPATGAPKLTAAQLRVQRADSLRAAHERAKADSAARLAERKRTDSLARVVADSVRADSLARARETEVLRETYSYAGSSRDPFQSVISTGKTGADISDLILVTIVADARSARNSVAVLREKQGPHRYRVKIGDKIGNATVSLITQHDVTFSVQDFGFERQETLSLRTPTESTP